MTDLERFTQTMARMMNKDTESNWWCEKCNCIVNPYGVTYNETHEVCGYPVIWKDSWSSITPEGELTPECRKWWAENLPEAWEEYCDFIYCDIDFTNIRTFYSEVLEAQLSAENLWKWMRENTDSWLYRECMYKCEVCGKKDCKYYGIGKVARWDVEKWLEGK